jgi:hypothetical protein
MSIDFSPLNALAAQLGEETVLAMARAYIDSIFERRAGIAPESWMHMTTPPRSEVMQTPPRIERRSSNGDEARRSLDIRQRLWQETIRATPDNLFNLIDCIEDADDAGLSAEEEEYMDALSRLDALRALGEIQ